MAPSDGFGQLGDRGVHDREVVGRGVRAGDAGPQGDGEGLTGRVTCRDHRVEPVAALEVRRSVFLVLRMDLDQGRVHIDHNGTVTCVEVLPDPPARAPPPAPSRARRHNSPAPA